MSFDNEQAAVIGLLVIGVSAGIIATIVLIYFFYVCCSNCYCPRPSCDCCNRPQRVTIPIMNGTFQQQNPIHSPA